VSRLSSASGASSDSKHFEAHFQESNVSVTNRIADLGLFQLMNTGTGTWSTGSAPRR
jgi:hypothetical protein